MSRTLLGMSPIRVASASSRCYRPRRGADFRGMNPPVVYEVTRPNAHRTTRRTAGVHSMMCLSLLDSKPSTCRAAHAVDRLCRILGSVDVDTARIRVGGAELAQFSTLIPWRTGGTTLVETRSMSSRKKSAKTLESQVADHVAVTTTQASSPSALRQRIDKWRDTLSEQINGTPGSTVVIALGTGYLLAGGLFPRLTARLAGLGMRIGIRVGGTRLLETCLRTFPEERAARPRS